MDGLGLVLIIGLVAILYLLPTFFAYINKCKHREGILVLNLFLGWTLLGWVL